MKNVADCDVAGVLTIATLNDISKEAVIFDITASAWRLEPSRLSQRIPASCASSFPLGLSAGTKRCTRSPFWTSPV